MSGSRLRAGPALGPIQRSIMPGPWDLRWRVPGVIPPMLKPQRVRRKLERGSPHCWLKFSEWNEFKTENKDLNPQGPIRCFSLWTCWGLVFSSLSYLTLAFYLFLRKYCHFLSAYCAPGPVLTPHQPITVTCTLLRRRPRPWRAWPRSCHSEAFCCRLSLVMFWNT